MNSPNQFPNSTPWIARIATPELNVTPAIQTESGLHICDVASYGASPITRNANAALIVAAVNEYDALCAVVEASKNLLNGLHGVETRIQLGEVLDDALSTLATIRKGKLWQLKPNPL